MRVEEEVLNRQASHAELPIDQIRGAPLDAAELPPDLRQMRGAEGTRTPDPLPAICHQRDAGYPAMSRSR